MSRRRCGGEDGVVAIIAAMALTTFLFACAALGVDVARMYLEGQRVQSAADAAALAGVTWLPLMDSATSEAIETSTQNGYPNCPTKTSPGCSAATTSVSVGPGKQSSQLKVTVCSTIDNAFAAAFGVNKATVCRSSIADYTGPQPMGSPCNTLGNEPAGTPGAGPEASQLKLATTYSCSTNPQFWMSAAGPEVYKTQGDQFLTRACVPNSDDQESGCAGTKASPTNDDFDPAGYFMLVRVDKAAAKKTLTLQLYDPAYVSTNSSCTLAPSGTFPTGSGANNWNPFTTTDGLTRYRKTPSGGDPNGFCSGDNASVGLRRGATDRNESDKVREVPTTTSFGLRAPVASKNPLDAKPVGNCTKQYPGYSDPTVNQLLSTSGSYNARLAAVFHEWNTLCTFNPNGVPGDYYLQVRTNVPLQGTVNNSGPNVGSYVPSSAASSSMYTSDDDYAAEKGNGINRFAVRVFATNNDGSVGDVAVSTYGRMPIFANATSASPQFNLIRILPAAAGKALVFKFFDVGESAKSPGGTLTVVPPPDATGSTITGSGTSKRISGCSASGYRTYSTAQMSSCSISNIYGPDGWDGKVETIVVPIPRDYKCTVDTSTVNGGGCWFRVQMNFNDTGVTDATTWSAAITGAPVRLIE